MRALVLEDGDIRVVDREKPVPQENEALIKVLKAGICNTDIELIKGYLNFSGILGHEFVGQVVEAPDRDLVGRRVVGDINISCGVCDYCRKGESGHCPSRQVLGINNRNGAFAEYLTLPAKNLYSVPHNVSNTEAVFAEPLAAACEILEQIDIRPGMDVAVLGDGKLGILIAQVMKLKTPRVSCLGKHDKKLETLRKRGIHIRKNDELLSNSYDVVVEATGSKSGTAQAMALVRPRGTIVLKSTVHGETPIDLSKIVIDEIVLVGSRCGPLEKALDLLEKKKVDVESLVDREFPLENAVDGLSFAREPGIVKILLVP